MMRKFLPHTKKIPTLWRNPHVNRPLFSSVVFLRREQNRNFLKLPKVSIVLEHERVLNIYNLGIGDYKVFRFVPRFIKKDIEIYKKHFDPSFDENEFIEGAQNAIRTVRNIIFSGDWRSTENMFTQTCFKKLKRMFEEEAITVEGECIDVAEPKIVGIFNKVVDGKVHTEIIVAAKVEEWANVTKGTKEYNRDLNTYPCNAIFYRESNDAPWKLAGMGVLPKPEQMGKHIIMEKKEKEEDE